MKNLKTYKVGTPTSDAVSVHVGLNDVPKFAAYSYVDALRRDFVTSGASGEFEFTSKVTVADESLSETFDGDELLTFVKKINRLVGGQ